MSMQPNVLFMAQLLPPIHGQAMIAGAVHQTLKDLYGAQITHLWKGGAKSATDVGKRSIKKYVEFAHMALILVFYALSFRRFEIAYLGVAPWAHTISRDAILMFLAKRVARRVLVHVHGDGLHQYMYPTSIRERIIASSFKNTELIAITENLLSDARQSDIFSAVHHLPNFAPTPELKPNATAKPCM